MEKITYQIEAEKNWRIIKNFIERKCNPVESRGIYEALGYLSGVVEHGIKYVCSNKFVEVDLLK